MYKVQKFRQALNEHPKHIQDVHLVVNSVDEVVDHVSSEADAGPVTTFGSVVPAMGVKGGNKTETTTTP